MSWRDGVHLTGTAIWCDAKRARDICFVSVAAALPHARHGQLIATAQTLQLLDKPSEQAASKLAVPLGQPFTLGTQRLELFSSGHAYGAASLLVRTDDARVVYAGAVGPKPSELGGAMDQRSADVLVLAAPYGQKHFAFEDTMAVKEELTDRCRQISSDGGIAVLLVDGIGKAMETAALLSASVLPVTAHRSFHEVSRAANKNGAGLPAPLRWNPKSKGARPLLWPLAKWDKIQLDQLPAESQILLVSGRAADSENVLAAGASEGFAWSNQADHAGLVQYIRDSGATQVFLTHSVDRGADLADALPGIKVQAIGPPEQLTLF